MKTTIDIADDLIKRARQVQKREDITLRALVEEGLHYAIGQHARSVAKYKFNPVVVGKPYKPGMPVMDVTAIIRETYEESENRMLKSVFAESAVQGAKAVKLRKKVRK
ncbi:MAG: hypothetical protein ABJB01_13495 [Rudaea sp.]